MAKVIHLDKNIDDYQAIEGLEYKTIDVSTKAFDDEKFEFDITMTSNSRDSDNEVIVQDGIDFSFFDKQGAVLYNHGAFSDDVQVVGKVVKRTELKNRHVARVQMRVNDWDGTGYPNKALLLYKLYKSGTMKSASIGFRVLERDPNDRDIIKRISLKELSLVVVPAQPDAMTKAIKSGNLSTKQLDELITEYKSLKKVLTAQAINHSMPNMTKVTKAKTSTKATVKSLAKELIQMSKANAELSGSIVTANKTIAELNAKLATATAPETPDEDKELTDEDKAELKQAEESAYNDEYTKAIKEAQGKVD